MRVIVPGSFDPPTLGHMDLTRRAAKLFDEVIVAIMRNPNKREWLNAEVRKKLLLENVREYGDVSVMVWEGSLAALVRESGAKAIIRGVRSKGEFAYEYPYAIMNERLCGAETIFLPSEPALGVISSSAVREIALYEPIPEGLVSGDVKFYIDNMEKEDTRKVK